MSTFNDQKKVLIALEEEFHIKELREKLDSYIERVSELYKRLDALRNEQKILQDKISQQKSVHEQMDVAMKYPKGTGNNQIRKEYLEELMNEDRIVRDSRSQLEVTEADIEEVKAAIDLIEYETSFAYHLDELNLARFKFIASNNMGSYDSTRKKLLEIEKYYKISDIIQNIYRYMDGIMPDKQKLLDLQKEYAAMVKNEANNLAKDNCLEAIDYLKKQIELKNKDMNMQKRKILWHASRISLLANSNYANTIT